MVRLQPGGWESPWDVFLQAWPAWKDDASLTDPLADADGDGMANLLEMATGTDVLLRDETKPLDVPKTAAGASLRAAFTEQVWALRGPPGARPFSLVLEGTGDFQTWTGVDHTVEPDGADYKKHSWEPAPAGGANPAAQFFRLRVSR